ncbi:methyltransferase domain-containing protein [Aureococcus anophagefferens]|nr:methyltransferase domain-containing protein [Aureococcus anophagefferens]
MCSRCAALLLLGAVNAQAMGSRSIPLLLLGAVVAQDIYSVTVTIDGGGRAAAAARVAAVMEAAVTTRRNVELYKSVWDGYADRWRADKHGVGVANEHRDASTPLVWLGDEWGPSGDFLEVFESYVAPHLLPGGNVAEIGVGGGRVAARVAPRVARLHAFDVSSSMLAFARETLAGFDNVAFTLLAEPRFDAALHGSFDFVYAFDAFVHVDLHTMWRYFQQFALVLKPGGRGYVFGFYFMTPDMVRRLLAKAGLAVVRESPEVPGNLLLERDFLVVFERPAS